MNRLDKVFIAAIDGLALGGGFILALACDIRLMVDGDHRIGLPEGALGFIAAAGGTQRCARLIGPGRTLDLLLDGRLLRPSEAAEIGLINRAVPAADLLPAAEELAERLSRRSPFAVREIKRCIYDGGSRRLPAGLRVEEASMLATVSSAASLRALDAYHAELGPMDATEQRRRDRRLGAFARRNPGRHDRAMNKGAYLDAADRSWPVLRRVMGLHTFAYRATKGRVGQPHTGSPRAHPAARPRRREERGEAHLSPLLHRRRRRRGPDRRQGRLLEAPGLVPQPQGQPRHDRPDPP